MKLQATQIKNLNAIKGSDHPNAYELLRICKVC